MTPSTPLSSTQVNWIGKKSDAQTSDGSKPDECVIRLASYLQVFIFVGILDNAETPQQKLGLDHLLSTEINQCEVTSAAPVAVKYRRYHCPFPDKKGNSGVDAHLFVNAKFSPYHSFSPGIFNHDSSLLLTLNTDKRGEKKIKDVEWNLTELKSHEGFLSFKLWQHLLRPSHFN